MPNTDFSIDHAGQRWSAAWTEVDGQVRVSSAYGSRSAEPGRRKPQLVAEQILHELVEEWRRRP